MPRSAASLVLASALLAPAAVSATELEDASNALAPGEWIEFPAQGITIELLTNGDEGSTVIMYSDEAVWDPSSRKMFYLGTPHSPYHGSGKMIAYDELDNAWYEPEQPPFQAGMFWHGYDHMAIDEDAGILYYRENERVHRYDIAANAWDRLPDIPAYSTECCGGLTMFPTAGVLIYVDTNWGLWSFELAAEEWTHIANTGVLDDYPGQPNYPATDTFHQIAKWNSVADVVLFGGGNDSRAVYRMAPDLSVQTSDEAPEVFGVARSIVVPDPASPTYIVITEGGSEYEYSPHNDQWAVLDIGIFPELSINESIAIPVSSYGVIAFLAFKFGDSAMYLYKHQECDGCPGAPPPGGGESGGSDGGPGDDGTPGDGDGSADGGGDGGATSAGDGTGGDETSDNGGGGDGEGEGDGGSSVEVACACKAGQRQSPWSGLWGVMLLAWRLRRCTRTRSIAGRLRGKP